MVVEISDVSADDRVRLVASFLQGPGPEIQDTPFGGAYCERFGIVTHGSKPFVILEHFRDTIGPSQPPMFNSSTTVQF